MGDGKRDCEGLHIAVAEKLENYYKEISRDFPFKGCAAVKQKGLHGGWEGGLRRCTYCKEAGWSKSKRVRRAVSEYPMCSSPIVSSQLSAGSDGERSGPPLYTVKCIHTSLWIISIGILFCATRICSYKLIQQVGRLREVSSPLIAN